MTTLILTVCLMNSMTYCDVSTVTTYEKSEDCQRVLVLTPDEITKDGFVITRKCM